jgi:hypothetical protein
MKKQARDAGYYQTHQPHGSQRVGAWLLLSKKHCLLLDQKTLTVFTAP